MFIDHRVSINSAAISRDGIPFGHGPIHTADEMYHALGCAYPKFYKMDPLCKWAFVAAEYLFGSGERPYNELDKNNIAVVLGTSHGCLDADKRYAETIAMPSPALFVYTLPNIMLGELSIRHGFKGEQLCMISEAFDTHELYFNVHRLLSQAGMNACLCGWVDVFGGQHEIQLFWVSKRGHGQQLKPENLLAYQ